MSARRIVALEEHLVTEPVLAAWHELEPRWQDLSLNETQQGRAGHMVAAAGAKRLAAMDEVGVDVQVLSLTTPETAFPQLSAFLQNREEVKSMKAWTRFEDWTNVILGVYLFFVPFFVAANAASAWNAYIVGILILCVALFGLAQPQSQGVEWTNVVLGAWMVIAPFVLSSAALAGAMALNAYVIGALVIIFAGIALYRMGQSKTVADRGTR